MTPNTDFAKSIEVLNELLRLAYHHHPDSRLLGNVRAGDMQRALQYVCDNSLIIRELHKEE